MILHLSRNRVLIVYSGKKPYLMFLRAYSFNDIILTARKFKTLFRRLSMKFISLYQKNQPIETNFNEIKASTKFPGGFLRSVIFVGGLPFCLWKSKTRVTSCRLRVQIYELRVQIHELRVQIHELRRQIHELGD